MRPYRETRVRDREKTESRRRPPSQACGDRLRRSQPKPAHRAWKPSTSPYRGSSRLPQSPRRAEDPQSHRPPRPPRRTGRRSEAGRRHRQDDDNRRGQGRGHQSVNSEREYNTKQIAAALFRMKKTGVLEQAQARGPTPSVPMRHGRSDHPHRGRTCRSLLRPWNCVSSD